jgi:hypothetical protein
MLRSEYRLLARPVGRVMRDQRFGFSILGRFKGACHDTLSNNFPEYSSALIMNKYITMTLINQCHFKICKFYPLIEISRSIESASAL